MSLPSCSDLVDEIKTLYVEKTKTDAKMRFYTGIASAALFNTIFT